MPGRSQKKQLQGWQDLLREARVREIELAALIDLRQKLEQSYTRAISTRCMRETLLKTKIGTTQQLREVLAEGKEAEAQLRRMVKEGRR
ncbi:MAG TPA: hypothetical protein VKM72_13825 [Thermoanaerobaculia bacterium]|nr:hypothetical protein [Thermoanaerobaculia bacterium]